MVCVCFSWGVRFRLRVWCFVFLKGGGLPPGCGASPARFARGTAPGSVSCALRSSGPSSGRPRPGADAPSPPPSGRGLWDAAWWFPYVLLCFFLFAGVRESRLAGCWFRADVLAAARHPPAGCCLRWVGSGLGRFALSCRAVPDFFARRLAEKAIRRRLF